MQELRGIPQLYLSMMVKNNYHEADTFSSNPINPKKVY